MRPSRLVLVRWQGDVIATQTLGKGQAPDVSALPPDAPETGAFSLEVIDVASARVSFRGPFAWRPLLVALGSAALHAAAAALLVASWRRTPQSDIDRDRLAALHSYSAKLAVSDAAPTPEVHVAAPTESAAASVPQTAPTAVPTSAPAPLVSRARAMKNGDSTAPSAPAVCTPPHASASSGPTCSRAVIVSSITRSSPGCFTDDAISVGEVGTLSYPCSGDGPAKVTFGAASFEGADEGGKLTACTGTQFDWSDGCTWTSAQTVTGSIASGALRFTYGEAPKTRASTCASACTAAGSLRIDP